MKTKLLTKIFIALAVLFVVAPASAQTPVEVKLQAFLEEDRGWCLDLRGPAIRAAIKGGVHGHTCYLYQGNGVSLDQGYIQEDILEKDTFRMSSFDDQCMTLYEPKSGAFASLETCDGRITQDISLTETGHIIPAMAPDLCLTIGTQTLPGGGSSPLHILKSVDFQTCDDSISERQTWELRAEWTGLGEATEPRTWEPVPGGMAGGGGMGGGMGGMGGGMGAGMGGGMAPAATEAAVEE